MDVDRGGEGHGGEGEEEEPTLWWGRDDAFWAHVRLFAGDVLALSPARDLAEAYLHRGRPVRKVEVMGIVVQRQERERLLTFSVDDGSGVVPCALWKPRVVLPQALRNMPLEERAQHEADQGAFAEQQAQVALGALLRVQGKVGEFRGARQLTTASVQAERDPAAEVVHWLEYVRLQRAYSRPRLSASAGAEGAMEVGGGGAGGGVASGTVPVPPLRSLGAVGDAVLAAVQEAGRACYQDILTHPAAAAAAAAAGGVAPPAGGVEAAIHKALMSLQKAGRVYLVDVQEDIYAPQDDQALKGEVLALALAVCARVDRHAEGQGGGSSSPAGMDAAGAAKADIIRAVQSQRTLQHAARGRVEAALNHLVEASQLYEAGDGKCIRYRGV